MITIAQISSLTHLLHNYTGKMLIPFHINIPRRVYKNPVAIMPTLSQSFCYTILSVALSHLGKDPETILLC